MARAGQHLESGAVQVLETGLEGAIISFLLYLIINQFNIFFMPIIATTPELEQAKQVKLKAFMLRPENKEIAEVEYNNILKAVLAQRVKEIRKAKKLSQVKFAELLGVKQPEIARMEKGDTQPNFSTISKLLYAINGRFEIIY